MGSKDDSQRQARETAVVDVELFHEQCEYGNSLFVAARIGHLTIRALVVVLSLLPTEDPVPMDFSLRHSWTVHKKAEASHDLHHCWKIGSI